MFLSKVLVMFSQREKIKQGDITDIAYSCNSRRRQKSMLIFINLSMLDTPPWLPIFCFNGDRVYFKTNCHVGLFQESLRYSAAVFYVGCFAGLRSVVVI